MVASTPSYEPPRVEGFSRLCRYRLDPAPWWHISSPTEGRRDSENPPSILAGSRCSPLKASSAALEVQVEFDKQVYWLAVELVAIFFSLTGNGTVVEEGNRQNRRCWDFDEVRPWNAQALKNLKAAFGFARLMRALGAWSGGVLVAGPDSTLREAPRPPRIEVARPA